MATALIPTDADAWVDLGLPGGLLWAACNLGASMPSGQGSHYAWGETQPKDTYNWETYRHAKPGHVGADMAKYCTMWTYGHNGKVDNLTALQPGDDAATAAQGDGMRMPTQEDWQELLDNTTSEWTTMNGVNGRRLTAANGNSIFLPAAGFRRDDKLHYNGERGYYWSSSLDTDDQYIALYFRFHAGGQGLDDDRYRGYGMSVRAVRPAR